MNKQWLCLNCLTQIALDIHGRCSACGSDAVDRIEHRATLFDGRDIPFTVSTQTGPILPMKPIFRYWHG
jgi:hypothetical protein